MNKLRNDALELLMVWFLVFSALSIIPSCCKFLSAFNEQVINKHDGSIRIHPGMFVPCDYFDRVRSTAALRKVVKPQTVSTSII